MDINNNFVSAQNAYKLPLVKHVKVFFFFYGAAVQKNSINTISWCHCMLHSCRKHECLHVGLYARCWGENS